MRQHISKFFKISTLSILLFTLSTCKSGSGSNIDIPKLQGPKVSLSFDDITISMVIENIETTGQSTYAIPKLMHSYIDIREHLETKGTSLKVVISLQDLLGDLTILDPKFLPGGRNIPGVPSGALPALAITIPKLKNTTFYIGTKVFGIFVPFNINVDHSILTFRYYINGNKSGNISIIGRDQNGQNSGMLLLLDLKKKTRKYLKKIAKKYRYRN